MNVELFPCSGGMAEGFRRAGIVFDLAFDKDPHAVESYGHNLGHRPIHMDVNDVHRLVVAGWRPGSIDLLVADPPCTPWSRAGKRQGLEDERDCIAVTADLIALLRPRAYLIGNVPGLQDSTLWHVVQDVIGGLAKHGYCVADYVSLDSADYGVPQHRVRPFWYGHLSGPCIRWPAPTHGAPTDQLAIDGHALKPWVTCREALGHLSIEELGRPVRIVLRPNINASENGGRKQGSDITRCSAPDRPARTVVTNNGSKGGQILIPNEGHPLCAPDAPDAPAPTIRGGGECHSAPHVVLRANDKHPVSSLDEPSKTVTGSRANRGAQGGHAVAAQRNWDNHPDSTPGELEWPWNRPSTSVSDSDDRLPQPGHHAGGTGHSTQHGPNAIVLSERAAAILQGFPEGWLFSGDTKKARWSQLGQATPPLLAEAVAMAVAEQMRAAAVDRLTQEIGFSQGLAATAEASTGGGPGSAAPAPHLEASHEVVQRPRRSVAERGVAGGPGSVRSAAPARKSKNIQLNAMALSPATPRPSVPPSLVPNPEGGT